MVESNSNIRRKARNRRKAQKRKLRPVEAPAAAAKPHRAPTDVLVEKKPSRARGILGYQQRSPATVPLGEVYGREPEGKHSFPVGPAEQGLWPPKRDTPRTLSATARKVAEERSWRRLVAYKNGNAVYAGPPLRLRVEPRRGGAKAVW